MTIGRIPTQALSRLRQIDHLRGRPGHAHFWDRAFSRRQFVTAAASAASVLLASPLGAVTTGVKGNTPKPIPGGFVGPGNNLFHVFVPNVLHTNETDRSLISDFKGQVGFAVIDGMEPREPGRARRGWRSKWTFVYAGALRRRGWPPPPRDVLLHLTRSLHGSVGSSKSGQRFQSRHS
jgi:hypothetical protein